MKSLIPVLLAIGFALSCSKDKDNTPTSANPEEATSRTDSVGSITFTSAKVYSTIVSEGKSAVAANGIVWGPAPNPTTFNNIIPAKGFGKGSFTTDIKDLSEGTKYYVRTYATNSIGTSYSEQKEFTTRPKTIPIVSTAPITDISTFTAKGGGAVSDTGSGQIMERGLVWSKSQNPTIASAGKVGSGSGTGNFSGEIVGLEANTIYYIRAYAINSAGEGYGQEVSFTTLFERVPTVNTTIITEVGSFKANGGGSIIDTGSTSLTERGIVWSKSQNPTIASAGKVVSGSGTGNISGVIVGLEANTIYYLRAYAINSVGVGYGEQLSFKTKERKIDVDGNAYGLVSIGSQVWLTENLKTTKYLNGDLIGSTSNEAEWNNSTTGLFYAVSRPEGYGNLYNAIAVKDARKLCPAGTHLPSNIEWQTLFNSLGDSAMAAMKLKTTTGWDAVSGNGTNSSGFSALPAGYFYTYLSGGLNSRYENSNKITAYWALASGPAFLNGLTFAAFDNSARVGTESDPPVFKAGNSVRCIVD